MGRSARFTLGATAQAIFSIGFATVSGEFGYGTPVGIGKF
ncbi:MAG: hypothetical protein ACI9UA_002747, partial [Pseudoalteromonas tetraodonis]